MRALRFVLRAFPRAFRHRFENEVLDFIEGDLERARANGRFAALRFLMLTMVDLVVSGWAERAKPTWIDTSPSTGRNRGGENMVRAWIRDLRHAARSLTRAPGFTGIAVTTLALAVGATTGVFTIVERVLIAPLPYPDQDRLIFVAASAPGTDFLTFPQPRSWVFGLNLGF